MKRIIITEKQYNKIKRILAEEIQPSEAYSEHESLQTVLDGKRGVCFIVDYSKDTKKLINLGVKNGLKKIGIPQQNSDRIAYVIYVDGFEENANKLASIARKNGGYLPIKNPEETYVIGILLGYNKESVKTFVLQKFPDFKFY